MLSNADFQWVQCRQYTVIFKSFAGFHKLSPRQLQGKEDFQESRKEKKMESCNLNMLGAKILPRGFSASNDTTLFAIYVLWEWFKFKHIK